ncbi:MAG: ABC transporter ATP-binding protein [Thermoproteus sp.]
MLEVKGAVKKFGGVAALDGVDIEVGRGEVVALVGPNGAGKTTLINAIAGFLKLDGGRVLLEGKDITGLPPHKRTELGIVRTFQLPQLFRRMTVLENVEVALSAVTKYFKRPDLRWAEEVLKSFRLWDVRNKKVDELSEGHRKLLDVALAMALRPKLVLLDEPTSSVSSADKFEVMGLVASALRHDGVSAIIVEHDLDIVKTFADRVVQMYNGRIVSTTTPDKL